MDNLKLVFDFHLFDGEGGGEGGDASTAAPESGKEKVEYGKPKDNGQQPSQVGTDTGHEEPNLDAEFAELIGKGGRYHEVYGQRVSETIQDRFKNQADLQGQVNRIADDLSPLFMNYGLESGDFEGLKNAIANDNSFYQAAAEREGLDVNQYKENLRLKAEAERGRRITEAYQREQMKQERFGMWEAQADALRQSFPNFDLATEIEANESFRNLLDAGVDVSTAFVSTHIPEILNGSNADAETRATNNVVSAIQNRASRPIENGARHSAAIVRKTDPSKLSDEDLDEINRRVAEGESIAF